MPILTTGERLEALWIPSDVLDKLKLHKAQIRSRESLGRIGGQLLLLALRKEGHEEREAA